MARVLIIDRRAQPHPTATRLRALLGADQLAPTLAQADAVLVLVRPDFASVTNDDGHRLLFAPQDEVRSQVRATLEAGLPLLALLLDGASMPAQSALPTDLVPLARQQALSFDAANPNDVARLHSAIAHLTQGGASTTVEPPAVTDPQQDVPTTATLPVQPPVASSRAEARTPGPRTMPVLPADGPAQPRRERRGGLWAALSGGLLLAGLLTLWALLPARVPPPTADATATGTATVTAPPAATAAPSVVRPPALTPLGTPATIADGGGTATSARPTTTLAAAARPAGCDGALLPQLGVGMAALIDTTNDQRVNLRAQPATSAARQRQITPLHTVRVVGGPVCSDNMVWFEVDDGEGTGWLAEGTVREGYFVRPLLVNGVVQAAFAPRGAGCTRVVFDDFTRSASQWFTVEDPTFRLAAEDGAYTIEISAPNTTGIPLAWGTLQNEEFGDVHVAARVSATRFDGPSDQMSLWLNYQNARNFLAFSIRSDGHAAITRVSGGGTTFLRAWEPTTAIVTGDGAQNLVEVRRSGGTYTMHVNFVPVATTTDTTWARGRVGFRGASYRLPAVFRLEAFRACAQD